MAVKARHTFVSPAGPSPNPSWAGGPEWNADQPVSADGMGLLFADSAGDVAETMTVDMGTLTASTPLTFKQTWDNVAADVVFKGVRIEVNDGTQTNGDPTSKYFEVVTDDGVDNIPYFNVGPTGTRIAAPLRVTSLDGSETLYTLDENGAITFTASGGDDVAVINPFGVVVSGYTGGGVTLVDEASYSDTGIAHDGPANFTLPISETELAQWANVPTNTDIADGYSQVGVDTNTGDVYLAANVGGTIFKVQLT